MRIPKAMFLPTDKNRESGVLLAVSSLPGKYGIGTFGKEAYDFVDFLARSGQKYWQILPLGPTGYGDSPYQSFSTFAGNPYYIDLETLISEKLLTKKECSAAKLFDTVVGEDGIKRPSSKVNYEKIYFGKLPLLKKAFGRFDTKNKDFQAFLKAEKFWLDDYALYMAIKDEMGGISFLEWDHDLKVGKKTAIAAAKSRLKDEILYYSFLQYLFFRQWVKLKKYANDRDIKIIGDIPIYVALDSADTWRNPKLFQLDKDLNPVNVAGCPPDYFAKTGQLWGNPLYDWNYHEDTGYQWWIARIKQCFRLYDVVRIDHFRGFESFYAIPYGNKTAEIGQWVRGPGISLFTAIARELGSHQPIIAEDLGFVTDSVRSLINTTGYPGMKILEFAFDGNPENDYLPFNLGRNCVIYTGTHDNETVVGWYKGLSPKYRKVVKEYLNIRSGKEIHWEMIRYAFASVANTAIIPMQDLLGLDNEARMNIPSTLGNNWVWRMKEEDLTDALSEKLFNMTKIYGRL